jgi:hypothetical protein
MLVSDWLLSHFGDTRQGNLPTTVGCWRIGEAGPLAHTCHQILLGDETFVSAYQQSLRYDALKDA